MMAIEEARACLASVRPTRGIERRALVDAWGATLAEPIRAPGALPPFSRAAMDGYAVYAVDAQAGMSLPVSAHVAAGDWPLALARGTAARILTGAPVPPGADAVVEQESATRDGEGRITLTRSIRIGRNIMPAGHEWRPGDAVMAAGDRLTPTHLGLLSSLGLAEVPVYTPLRVSVVETGSELARPGTALSAGHIYETHAAWLGGLIPEWGGRLTRIVRVADDPSGIAQAVRRAADDSDLVLTTGGASVGDHDYVPQVLADIGERLFWRVSMHPGKATAAARVGDHLILALSGNPGAALMNWLVLGAFWWAAVHNAQLVDRRDARRLVDPFPRPSREPRFVAAVESGPDLRLVASTGVDALTPYLTADGLVVIPGDSDPVPPGSTVSYWRPTGFGGRIPLWRGARDPSEAGA